MCVSEHMKELKPFGDVPHKLSVEIKRSFVATRTFAQALTVAGDIVNNMLNVRSVQVIALFDYIFFVWCSYSRNVIIQIN